MRYLSVCSGIEAASVAWEPLGWTAAGFSEIEPFPSAVLAHRFPGVPNLGDMTKYGGWQDEAIDLLVGGTPCQAFSNAGLRRGMDDPRGRLAYAFSGIAQKYRPRWIVWENVPGVLSSGGGRDFGAFVGSLVELGYGLSWRVLDAQYFNLAQRRKRVFLVGYLGDWRYSSAVLFESQGLRGDTEKGNESWKKNSRESGINFEVSGWPSKIASTLNASFGEKQGLEDQHINQNCPLFVNGINEEKIRRLTPRECERLQGFPDDWSLIPWRGKPEDQCPDGPRYKAIGNSMAVPVMHWIGKRIQMVENIANG